MKNVKCLTPLLLAAVFAPAFAPRPAAAVIAANAPRCAPQIAADVSDDIEQAAKTIGMKVFETDARDIVTTTLESLAVRAGAGQASCVYGAAMRHLAAKGLETAKDDGAVSAQEARFAIADYLYRVDGETNGDAQRMFRSCQQVALFAMSAEKPLPAWCRAAFFRAGRAKK